MTAISWSYAGTARSACTLALVIAFPFTAGGVSRRVVTNKRGTSCTSSFDRALYYNKLRINSLLN